MTSIQIAFMLGAANLLLGLFQPSLLCLAIGLLVGLALWLEHRAHERSTRP